MRNLRPILLGGLVVVCALSSSAARAEEKNPRRAKLVATKETKTSTEDRSLAREALKRELAAFDFRALLGLPPPEKTKAEPSVWERDEPAAPSPMWTQTVADATPAGLTDPNRDTTGAGVPVGVVSTVGKGWGIDAARVDHFHTLTLSHVVAAPAVRRTDGGDGRLPSGAIQRVVHQNFGRFRLCYESGLRRNPSLGGRLAVKIVIDRTGAVVVAADAASSVPDPEVVACVVRSFANLTFPPSDAGDVTVVYALSLDPTR
jgi:hypothetical protein